MHNETVPFVVKDMVVAGGWLRQFRDSAPRLEFTKGDLQAIAQIVRLVALALALRAVVVVDRDVDLWRARRGSGALVVAARGIL